LVLKAGYMIAVNLLTRGKLKQHCLTFGDVLIASASHPEIRVQGLVLWQSNLHQHAHREQRMYGQCWRQLPSLLYAYVSQTLLQSGHIHHRWYVLRLLLLELRADLR
jgi:hypothetical protein